MKVLVECPLTSFPRSYARDYKETYFVPPVSTVYGFLLSLIGECDKERYKEASFTITMQKEVEYPSVVLRKLRHHKFSVGPQQKKRAAKYGDGVYPAHLFTKPNFQELLTDVEFIVDINTSNQHGVELADKVSTALTNPASIKRFGGLSLGESCFLVNNVKLV
jgi:CRISPR-associated protein Cas5t